MDPLSLALTGGSVASSLIGLFGNDDSGKQYRDKAIQELIKVHIPDPAQQQLALQRYQSTGELSPELEHSIKADPSAFQQIVQNQHYAQAQDRALGQLQSIGDEGGLRLSDKAALQDQLIASGNKDKANRDAITDEYARRGQGGSGMELQAQLSGAQQAGDRDSRSRLSALGSAQDRALQAISGAGDLAGKLQGQDYQRQSDAAAARDKISMFNTTNAQDVQQRNAASRNAAQKYNLDRSQQLSDSNADIANQEQKYNKSLDQKRFDNEMQRSGAIANAYTGHATQATADADRKRQAWGGVGSSLGQVGAAVQGQHNWNDWLNKATAKPASQNDGSGPVNAAPINTSSLDPLEQWRKKNVYGGEWS